MKAYKLTDNKGFTLVELMVATLVFSVVLLLCATAVVQVGRMYYKGVVIGRTEDSSRKAMDDVSQSIQFGASGITSPVLSAAYTNPARRAYCIGGIRYSFTTKAYIQTSTYSEVNHTVPHVLWKDRVGSTEACLPCNLGQASPSGAVTGDICTDGVELLAENMRVTNLTIGSDPSSGLWTVGLTVSYGEDDVFIDNGLGGQPANFTQCVSKNAGGQFCAVSALSSKVIKRL